MKARWLIGLLPCLALQPALADIEQENPLLLGSAYAAILTLSPFFITTLSVRSMGGGEPRLALARDDAASFLASDGAIRGAQLESALQLLRQRSELAGHNDRALAEAILARTL
ncbi:MULTISPECIES: DUF2388 domain-containing protein [unclassified Pseudomonas]|uniref:DUF2388 domain-containing protein n=1 Tax=unclassified Pseudomonas TaxID=196821 RepID=UPI001BCE6199|nr:DUF2388 domain-containing protein [Pseudomonas sp. Pc102]BBP86244.1 hypothetical protein PHLH8_58860 [Pseudomonas sp. Pc102]